MGWWQLKKPKPDSADLQSLPTIKNKKTHIKKGLSNIVESPFLN